MLSLKMLICCYSARPLRMTSLAVLHRYSRQQIPPSSNWQYEFNKKPPAYNRKMSEHIVAGCGYMLLLSSLHCSSLPLLAYYPGLNLRSEERGYLGLT